MNITPGKWTAYRNTNGIRVESPDYVICKMVGDASTTVRDWADATAISAVPDLIDALDPDMLDLIATELVHASKNCLHHRSRIDTLRELAKGQRAALAKAAGKPA